jgi:hypothetical protein
MLICPTYEGPASLAAASASVFQKETMMHGCGQMSAQHQHPDKKDSAAPPNSAKVSLPRTGERFRYQGNGHLLEGQRR